MWGDPTTRWPVRSLTSSDQAFGTVSWVGILGRIRELFWTRIVPLLGLTIESSMSLFVVTPRSRRALPFYSLVSSISTFDSEVRGAPTKRAPISPRLEKQPHWNSQKCLTNDIRRSYQHAYNKTPNENIWSFLF